MFAVIGVQLFKVKRHPAIHLESLLSERDCVTTFSLSLYLSLCLPLPSYSLSILSSVALTFTSVAHDDGSKFPAEHLRRPNFLLSKIQGVTEDGMVAMQNVD